MTLRYLDDAPAAPPQLRYLEEPPPGEPGPSVPLDVAKGIGSGIERGAIGLPGMPTDAFRLMQQAWLWSQGKLYGEEHRKRMEALAQEGGGLLPGSSELIEGAKRLGVPGVGFKPETGAGEVGQRFGEFIPGAVIPGQAALRGATTGARVARGAFDVATQAAAPAAAAEGAEAAAKGTRAEGWAGPLAAAITSFATGKLPAPRATTPLPGYHPGATERANRAITDEGGHAAVGETLAPLGPEARLMDAGPNLTGQAEALASSPGRAQSDILRVVRERNAAAGDRIAQGLERTIGAPGNYDAETRALLDQRRLQAERLYTAARAHPAAIDTTPVVQHIESVLPTNIAANASQPTSIERALLDARGRLQNRSDVGSLHNVKEALDDQIGAAVRAGEGGLAGRLGEVRDRLVRQLESGTTVAPGQSLYRTARETYAGDSAILRAREEGLSVFDRDVRPNAVARENLARSEAERIAFQGGAREAIEIKFDTARNDAKAVRDLFETNANRGKLNIIIGQQAADELLNVLRAETRMAGTGQRLTSASATAGRLAAQKEFPSAIPEGGKVHWPSLSEAPTRGLQWVHDRTTGALAQALGGGRRGEINADTARILTAPAAERADLLRQLQLAYERGQAPGVPFGRPAMGAWSAGIDEERTPLEITVHPSRRGR